MTRQDEFKDKLFALLREYQVEMSVVESDSGYGLCVDGIEFFSYTQYDQNGDVIAESIDFMIGVWENGNS